ncbi:MAG: 23S rRNA (uracil(1939)-C(5))-methyltransferase RlmD [Lachnospiraceae bacterium]|nr:23S rRNA (uracil(1939)-C(5))-methyltransferase RlmD [Lachnospiraceae bacterium]
MKKGEIYEGIVEKVLFPNKGVVKAETGEGVEKCVVKNVLPGQKIGFRVTKKRHGDCEGMLMSVIEKAADEKAVPNCPHFGVCGGCAYQSLSYEKQLEIKKNQVLYLLRPVLGNVGDDPAVFEGIFSSPDEFGYKNKMEFSFGDVCKGGELALGLHKRGSFYDVVPVPECRIVCDDIRKVITAVYDECRKQGLTYYHKMSHEGLLRHLVVRRSEKNNSLLVMLVTTSKEDFDIDAFAKRLKDLELQGTISGFLHCINDSLADNVQADELRVIFGEDSFTEELLGLNFKVTPFSFFQTNSKGAEVLYDVVRRFSLMGGTIKEKDRGDLPENSDSKGELPIVFDLYSGTGTIAQLLAPVAKKVIGVEIVEEAVESAKNNATLNGLVNCEFIAGDVLKVIDEIKEKPDFIILDPPRDGIHPKALPKLISYGVDNLVYISCKPTSLARDLPAFLEAGYTVKKLAMVDMFPWTANVETVVLLSQQNPDNRIRVKVDLDELDETGAEAKATYKRITGWVQEHYGFHVTNLNIAQVKRKNGIVERENYNKPKSEDSRQPETTPEKERAITEALKHLKMI